MSLNKQKISIPLAQGINTKIDPNQQPIGSLDYLENAVFDTPGRLKKRTGYDKLDATQISNVDIQNIQKITKFQDELCTFNPTNFFSYSESIQKWSDKGTVSNIFPTSESILRNTYQQSNIQSAHIVGTDVYAWEDARGGIRVSIIDNATGNQILSDTEITSSGIRPKVESIGNTVYFTYIDGTDIKYRTVNPIRPDTISAEIVAVSADVHASNKIYDTQTIGNRIFFVWNSSTATMKFRYLIEDGTLSTTQEEVGESPSVAISLNADSSSRLLIAYYDATDVKVIVRSFNLTSNIIAATSIETIANIKNVSIATADNANYTILYEQTAAASYNHIVRKNTINLAASVGTAANFLRSSALASKQFTHDNSIYVAVLHSSALQSSLFILNENAEVVSKISPNISGDLLTYGNLPQVSTVDSTNYLFASQIKGKTISEDNTLFSVLGVTSTTLDFDLDVKFDNAELGANLHTTGGMIQAYDGKQIVEHGFHVFPENLTAGTNAASGGSMSDGTYSYIAIYSWTDNKGQIHRSAPSIGLSVVTSAGGTAQTQAINVPTLRITEKQNVIIELYRTEDAGTTYYLVTSPSAPTYNDKTVNTVSIVDTRSDIDQIDNELLYTTGGVLENIAAPSASIIETFNNRIFLAGLEDDNKIQYSKIRQEGKPVEFNDTLIINVNSRGGKIKAIATMDDKLFIFKETAIYYLTGNGPNNLGQQNDFIEPELITNDVGCSTQNSVVLTPTGLMFKSAKGIYNITSGLQMSYIGSPVEKYNHLTIKAANLVQTKNQVVFLTNDQAIVYDYFIGKWSLFTNHIGISATSLDETYYYIRSNSEIYRSALHFTDAGSYVKLKLETSWISFAGVQDYQRVYRMLILGEYKSEHKLILKAAYNFLDAYVQEKVIDTSDFTTDTVYGGDSPYGTGTPYGGNGNKYQIRLNMKTQKCQSIKISIEDSQDDNYGEGLQISNLLFVIGAKKGEYKTPQSNNYGTN
jgi:hypothetical protein